MIALSSSILVGFAADTFFLAIVHKFSIGFKSGEFPGHCNAETLLSTNHFMTLCLVTRRWVQLKSCTVVQVHEID